MKRSPEPDDTNAPAPWKVETGSNPINWRGDLTTVGEGDFGKHPLYVETYQWSLAVLKWCQKLITSAESTINDEGEVEFQSVPGIESLIDLRKHAMAMSAKLAGGLSISNKDADEISVSLEFIGMAHQHASICLSLLRLMLLERTRTEEEEKTKQLVAEFALGAQRKVDAIQRHAERLRARIPLG